MKLAKLPNNEVAPGFASDTTTTDEGGNRWDFSKRHMREKAKNIIKETEPILLIGSPMCTAFSTGQNINKK